MSGCVNEFDRVVADSACKAANAKTISPSERIISYAVEGSTPAHLHGTLLRSKLRTWGLEFKRLEVPEPIHNADAVLIVGGGDGTMCAANWARIDNKLLLPITAFGGAGATTYNEEIAEFDTKYGDRVDQLEYEGLNQLPVDLRALAKDAVSLAAKIHASKHVFVIISLFWAGQTQLQEALRDKIGAIAYLQGRR